RRSAREAVSGRRRTRRGAAPAALARYSLAPRDEVAAIETLGVVHPLEIDTGEPDDLSERTVHRLIEAAPSVFLLHHAGDPSVGFRRAFADLLRRQRDLPIEPFRTGLRRKIQAADVDRAGDRLEAHVPLYRIGERRL